MNESLNLTCTYIWLFQCENFFSKPSLSFPRAQFLSSFLFSSFLLWFVFCPPFSLLSFLFSFPFFSFFLHWILLLSDSPVYVQNSHKDSWDTATESHWLCPREVLPQRWSSRKSKPPSGQYRQDKLPCVCPVALQLYARLCAWLFIGLLSGDSQPD